MIRPALCALALLAACASPQERCVADATEDLRVVNSLIAETEGNINRGYAVETVTEPRIGLAICTGRSNVAFCTSSEQTVRDRPVAIDLAAERQKLDGLVTKRGELELRARRAIAQCDSAA